MIYDITSGWWSYSCDVERWRRNDVDTSRPSATLFESFLTIFTLLENNLVTIENCDRLENKFKYWNSIYLIKVSINVWLNTFAIQVYSGLSFKSEQLYKSEFEF